MADAISIQELIDARTDAKTLEEAVNGDAVTTVLSRLGESYPTLANALSQIDGKLDNADAQIKQAITDLFQNGGLPATPFATKALMTASPLVDGKYAMVTNDAVNNGLYVKTAGAWVKSAYDPTMLANTYTDNKVKGVTNNFKTKALMTASTLPNDSYAMVTEDTEANNGWYSKVGGAWVKSAYAPLVQAKAYTDESTLKVKTAFDKHNLDGTINLSAFTPQNIYPSITLNKWVFDVAYRSLLIPVTASTRYMVEADASRANVLLYPISNIDLSTGFSSSKIESFNATKVITVTAGTTQTITIPSGTTYLLVSHNDAAANVLPKSIKMVGDSVIFKSDLSDSLIDSSKNKALSASAGYNLNSKIRAVDNYLEPLSKTSNPFEVWDSVAGTNRAYVTRTNLDWRTPNPNTYSYEIPLLAGDVLEFDYFSVQGTVLWHKIADFEGWSLLTTTVHDKNLVRSHSFTAYANMSVQITGSINGTIKVNGAVVDLMTVVDLKAWVRIQVENRNQDVKFAGYRVSAIRQLKKGDTVKVTNCGSGHTPILIESPQKNGVFISAVAVAPNNPVTEVQWTADSDTKVVLVGSPSSVFYVRKANNISNDIAEILVDYQSNSGGIVIDNVQMPELEYVFATHQNFVLKTEVKSGVEQIAISQDVGKTWTYTPNVIGDIVSYHFYSDGTIQLCSPTKVWWTSDYVTFNQAMVYDHDGSVFVPYTHHFFNQQNSDTTMFVGDTEIYVWGEYVVNNRYPRIWYSTDLGRTIKCCVKFDTTVMDGIVPRIRHVHDIAQDKDTETFYLTTGDVEQPTHSENYFFSAKYDVATDKFIWKKLGQGYQFKLGKLFFDKVYIYLITDYTAESGLSAQNGIYRVAKQHVGDWSKYRNIYKVNPAEWGSVAPFRLVMDRHGNKVLLLDWIGQGKIWVATEGMDFKKVMLSPNILLSYVIGPNYNGDVYCVTNNVPGDMTTNANLKLSGGTYNLTKALRNAGLRNFMTGNLLSNGLQGLNAY